MLYKWGNKIACIGLIIICCMDGPAAVEGRLRLATTTSTDNSGLLAVLHPPFEKKYNVAVDVIAVGTGRALRLGENGDVDIVMVHAPAAEHRFIMQEYGIERISVMYNDFVILGPSDDPAQLSTVKTIKEAMTRLATSGHAFISRGDNSGTHKKERVLWSTIGREPGGDWHISVGQGMAAALQIANNKQAYILSDRGTYLAYKKKVDLIPVFTGDPLLFNPYHIIIVNPKRHPHTNIVLAQKYVDFICGPVGQEIIGKFKIAGERLFNPSTTKQ